MRARQSKLRIDSHRGFGGSLCPLRLIGTFGPISRPWALVMFTCWKGFELLRTLSREWLMYHVSLRATKGQGLATFPAAAAAAKPVASMTKRLALLLGAINFERLSLLHRRWAHGAFRQGPAGHGVNVRPSYKAVRLRFRVLPTHFDRCSPTHVLDSIRRPCDSEASTLQNREAWHSVRFAFSSSTITLSCAKELEGFSKWPALR